MHILRVGSGELHSVLHDDLRNVLQALEQGGVVIIDDRLLVPEAALFPLTRNDRVTTTLLTAQDSKGDVRIRHHLVQAVGTSFHEVHAPTHRSVGALAIAPADAALARQALAELEAHLDHQTLLVSPHEFVEWCALALVRSGIPVRSTVIVAVPWTRSDNAEVRRSVQEQLAQVSNERIAALQANRIDDGFYSTFIVRKISKVFTRVALSWGLSPNVITVISFLVGLGAAASFAAGSRSWLIAGALLLQLSLVIDCVDGEVARATSRFSTLGAWLDASTDRVKEYAAYAGLAIGAAREGLDAWWIALALIVLQTARHMSDYNFSRIQRLREATVVPRALDDPSDDHVGGWSSAIEVSTRMNRIQAVHWVKKVVHMPIGERWLVLSVGAAFFNGYVALAALLVLTIFAFVYTLVGRVTRTVTWQRDTTLALSGAAIISAQLDRGPLMSWWSPSLTGRWLWAWPMILCAVEMGLVAFLGWRFFEEAAVLAYFYLFAVAYHHYDALYRALAGSTTPRWLTWIQGGWDGRTLLALLGAGVGLVAFSGYLAFGVVWLVLWGGIVASVQWLRVSRNLT